MNIVHPLSFHTTLFYGNKTIKAGELGGSVEAFHTTLFYGN